MSRCCGSGGGCCGCCSLRCCAMTVAVINLLIALAGVALTAYFSTRGEGVQWMRLGIHTVHLLFTCVLIHGIRREKRGLVMAWVWVTTFLVVGIVVLVVVELVKRENPHDYTPFVVLGAAVGAGLLIFAVRAYGLSLLTFQISDRRASA